MLCSTDIVIRRAWKLQQRLKERRPSIPQPLPKKLLSKSCEWTKKIYENIIDIHRITRNVLVLISDTLPLQHSFLQIFNMLIGPLALLTCGILLVTLSDNSTVLILYSRLVDPIICCILFISFCFMIVFPSKITH